MSRKSVARWLKHYLYGCFAAAWNDSITAVYAFIGVAVGSAMNPQAIQTPNWIMVGYVFGTKYVLNIIKYFAENPIPTKLSDGTNTPFEERILP